MPHFGTLIEQEVGGGATDVAHGHVHAGQRSNELGGDGHIVVADNGHVARDLQPASAHLTYGADGELVIGAEQCGERAGAVQQRSGPRSYLI